MAASKVFFIALRSDVFARFVSPRFLGLLPAKKNCDNPLRRVHHLHAHPTPLYASSVTSRSSPD